MNLEEALPGAMTYALLQGRGGRLWAGTGDGLAWHTGVGWQAVPIGSGHLTPAVRSLLEGADGSLWVGTERDWLWRLKDGQWNCFSPATGVALPAPRIQSLLETRNGLGQAILWVGTARGVARLDAGRWSFQGTAEGLPDPMVWKLRELVEPDGSLRIWAATAAGLARLQGERWQPVPLGPEFGNQLQANDVLSVPTASGGREVWASLWQVGLASWDGRRWRRHGPREGFPGRNPTGLALVERAGRQTLWAGTYSTGLTWFDGSWHRLAKADGFPGAFVLDVQAGPAGSHVLLAATKSAGVLAVAQGGWSTLVGWQGRLPIDTVTCLAEEPQPGRAPAMWLGTTGGLVRWDEGRGRLRTFSQELPSPYLQALLPRDLPGGGWGLWAGTLDGLMTYDGRRWQRVGPEAGFPGGAVSRLAQTRDEQGRSTLWVGLARGLAWQTGGHWRSELSPDALPATGTTSLLAAADPDGVTSLWVGTRGAGLRRFRQGRWTAFGQDSGLPSLGISALQRFTDGHGHGWLLAGTTHGELAWLSLDQAQARWVTATREALPHLPDSPLQSLETDAQGRLYLFSQRGVVLATLECAGVTLAVAEAGNYTLGDGLPSSACLSSLRDSQGRIWAGTLNGAAVLNPAQETPEPPLPAPAMLKVELLPAQTPVLDGARLSHRENHLLFQFGLPLHHRSSETQFRTELVGLEAPGLWQPIAFRDCSSLPAGRHTLRVWARNHQGRVTAPTEFHFQVRPAPWKSPQAMAVYAALAGVLGWLLQRLRTGALVIRNRNLEAQVQARTLLLERSNLALAEQNHRDPLTGLHNRRFVAETLDRDIAKVIRDHRPGAGSPDPNRAMLFLMVDLDHFKAVNDRHGHRAGDAVLVQTAQVLTRAMRESDAVVRWGGEEFLGLARGLNPAEATGLAERVRADLAAHVFELRPGLQIRLTCSIGFAVFPLFPEQAEALSWERTLELADECLYEAKGNGRNRWAGLLPKSGLVAPELASGQPPHAQALVAAGLVTWAGGQSL